MGISSPEAIADWVETSLLVRNSGSLALDRTLQLGREELGVSGNRVSMALQVMSQRANTLGVLYPFEVVDGIAVKRRQNSPFVNSYATLLLLTPSSVARQIVPGLSVAGMSELMEDIATRALSNYWGPGGEAIRFGYPSTHGRPKEFDQAVVWLANRIGVSPGLGYRPPRRKDGGVDVVAWRRFFDKRAGFPLALAQCTIQEEKFTKTTDIDVRLWSTWLALDRDPLSILVLPGTVQRAGPYWAQLTSVVTVIERLRLVELLARSEDLDTPRVWTTSVTSNLAERLAAAED
ncbi:MAG: hypothetical protein ACRDVF_00395 [Microbacterium sp.]|uniref:hypothetical protein n=1 Tax=Microbacterium sp. TaxID=51671 RepID=UPI003D701CA2